MPDETSPAYYIDHPREQLLKAVRAWVAAVADTSAKHEALKARNLWGIPSRFQAFRRPDDSLIVDVESWDAPEI